MKEGKFVDIPSLKISFLAVMVNNVLNFICLQDAEALGFKQGLMLPAADVLNKLVPVANEYNGLPH